MKTIGILASPNSKKVSESRVEFIKTNFADFLHMNPYRSPELIDTIKRKMLEVGLYGPSTSLSCANIDSAVINYFVKAKGQTVLKNYRSSRTARSSGALCEV